MKSVDMELIRRTVVGGTVADSLFSPMVEAILHLVDREGNSLGTVTGRVQARRRTAGEEREEFDEISVNSNTLHSPEASYATDACADPFQAFGRLGDEGDEGAATELSLSKAFKSEQNLNSPLFKTVVTHSLPSRGRRATGDSGKGAAAIRQPRPTPFESYDFTKDFHAANDNSIQFHAADGNPGGALSKGGPAFQDQEDDFFADDGDNLDGVVACPKSDTSAGAGGARPSKAKTDGSKSNAFPLIGSKWDGSKSNVSEPNRLESKGSGLNGSPSGCSKLNGLGLNRSPLNCLELNGPEPKGSPLNGSPSNCLEPNGSGLASSQSECSESDTWEEEESDRSFHFRNHIELWQMGEEATLVLRRPGWARRMVRRRIRLMKEGMKRLKKNAFRRFPRIARRIAALDAVHVPFRPSFLRKPTGGKAGDESEELIPLEEFDRWDQFQHSAAEGGAVESAGRDAARATLEDNPAGRHERERGAKRGQDLAASQGANGGPGQNRLVMARSIAWGMSATALGLSLAFLTLAMVGCEGTDAEGAGAAALDLNLGLELTAANSNGEGGNEVSENGRNGQTFQTDGSGGSRRFGILPLSPVSRWTPGGLLREAPMNGDDGGGDDSDDSGDAGELGDSGDAGDAKDSGDSGTSGFPDSSGGGESTGIPEYYGNPDDVGEVVDAGGGDADSHESGENGTGGAGSGGGCPPAPSGNHSGNHGEDNSGGHGSAALELGNGDPLPAVRWFVDRLEDGLAAVMDEEGETWIVSEDELPEGAREGAYFLAGPLFPKDGFGGECPKWNTDTEAELLWLEGVPVPVPPDCNVQFCQIDEEYGEAIAQQIATTLANLMADDDGEDIVL